MIRRANMYLIMCLTILVATAFPNPLKAEQSKDHYELTWISKNSTINGLPNEVRNMYITLYNTRLLPLKKIKIEKDISIPSKFLLDHMPLIEWTSQVDNLICDLNSSLCDRPRIKKKDLIIVNPDHVDGYELSDPAKSNWQLKKGSEIILPDLKFELYPQWLTQEINTNNRRSVRANYEQNALGCGLLGEINDKRKRLSTGQNLAQFKRMLKSIEPYNCASLIAQKNSYSFSYTSIQKKLISKKSSQSKSKQVMNFTNSHLSMVEDALNQDAAWSELEKFVDKIYSGEDKTPAQLEFPVASLITNIIEPPDSISLLQDPGLVEELDLLKRLELLETNQRQYSWRDLSLINGKNISKGQADKINVTLDNSPITLNIANLYKQISYTTNTISDNGANTARCIIFVDKNINKDHCIFKSSLCTTSPKILNFENKNLMDSFQSGPDSQIVNAIKNEEENLHGLQVASIAVSKHESGYNGIDPGAEFQVSKVNFDEHWDLDEATINNIENTTRSSTFVWNISGHTEDRKNVKGIINHTYNQKKNDARDIFVVSAGNLTKNKIQEINSQAEDCNVYPACMLNDASSVLRKNMIVVVGVMEEDDNNGNKKMVRFKHGDYESFYEPTFQIAAPASNIVVPTNNPNFWELQNGVSFAVPQVSATISALRANTYLTTKEVFGRLMGCGLQYESLKEDPRDDVYITMGGVLDVDCMLNSTFDQIAYNQDVTGKQSTSSKTSLINGDIVEIWQEDFKRRVDVLTIGIGDEKDYKIRGDYRLKPEYGSNSLIGLRPLQDNPELFKLVTWEGYGGAETIKAEVRPNLSSKIVLEFRPENSNETVCIYAKDLLAYIPKAISERENNHASKVPSCPKPKI